MCLNHLLPVMTVLALSLCATTFAKVRYLYQATGLELTDRCRIEYFNGPHTINAVGTFDFLHHH